ncbi:MAG: hypothetical protein ACSHX4_03890 [Opitutaceae bacterium]
MAQQLEKEAIILIHGMDGKEPNLILNKLERGIRSADHLSSIQVHPDIEIGNKVGRCIQYTRGSTPQKAKELHLFEAYWGDHYEALTKRPIREQITRGICLLLFWAGTPVRKTKNRYIAFGGMLTALGLTLWWYGVLATGLNLIALPSGQPLNVFIDQIAESLYLPLAFLCYMFSAFMNWKIGVLALISSGTFAMLIDSVVNTLNFAYNYLHSQNMRESIWKRISHLVETLENEGDYKRITILSHSFGCVIHVDYLADYCSSSDTPIRHITMGGPLAVMALRSSSLRQRLVHALNNPATRPQLWIDYYSEVDWMCTATPDGSPHYSFNQEDILATKRKIEHRELTFNAKTLWQRAQGGYKYHTQYFQESQIIDELLN